MAYIPWWQRLSPPTFAERFDLGGLAGRQPFAPENTIRIANPNFQKSNIKPIMVEESQVLQMLGIEEGSTAKQTFQTNKYKNKGNYNKLIQITGEPVTGADTVPGTQHKKTYYNVADLNKKNISWVNEPKSRITYHPPGKGHLVTNDKNLRQLFIKYYNLGHGPKYIMEKIDPNNKLNIKNPSGYGDDVAKTLIDEGAMKLRSGQSVEHKIYTDKKTLATDLEIEKIAKVYDLDPRGALNKIAYELAGGKAKFDKLSPRMQTEYLNKAAIRSYHLLQYLEGNRPSVDKNTTYKIKNKEVIREMLIKGKHPMWGYVRAGDVRSSQFLEMDKFFGDTQGTHEKARKDIHKELKLQASGHKVKSMFVIDEGPALTAALKNGLTVLTRFSNLINKKTNSAKIELDLKLSTIYPILTNLEHGQNKYKITAADIKKSNLYGWGLKEKDIGKIINKKDHPAIKEYNKFSKSFSKANKVKTPIFRFGDIGTNLDLNDTRWVTKDAAKELKKLNKKYGFYMDNMGTDLKLIKTQLQERPLKKSDFTKKAVVMMRMRDGLAKLYNKIPLKGVRLGASSAAAVLDYSFFHYIMGVPSAAAATGAALWFVKNPKEAVKISSALMAMSGGEMTIDEFISKHGATLVGISSDAVLSETPPKEKGPMVWKQGILNVADNMARGGLSGVDQYIINRGI